MKTVKTLIDELQALSDKHGKDTPAVVYDNEAFHDIEIESVEANEDDDPVTVLVCIN